MDSSTVQRYGILMWTQKKAVERVQNQAIWWLCDLRPREECSITLLKKDLSLQTLEERGLQQCLALLYKVINGEVAITTEDLCMTPADGRTCASHQHKFKKKGGPGLAWTGWMNTGENRCLPLSDLVIGWNIKIMLHRNSNASFIIIQDCLIQCSWKTFMVHPTFVRWALYILFKFFKSLIRHWGGWGCEVSCGGHNWLRGKTTTGSALDGAVFDFTQILAYLVHNMSRSQLYLGFGHFGWLPSFFGQ